MKDNRSDFLMKSCMTSLAASTLLSTSCESSVGIPNAVKYKKIGYQEYSNMPEACAFVDIVRALDDTDQVKIGFPKIFKS